MKRRTFLQGGAMGVAGLSMTPALAHYESNGRHPTPEDLGASVTRLRKQFLAEFDAAYVENVIVPHFLVSIYQGERPFAAHDRCGAHQGERACPTIFGDC